MNLRRRIKKLEARAERTEDQAPLRHELLTLLLQEEFQPALVERHGELLPLLGETFGFGLVPVGIGAGSPLAVG